MSTYPTAHEIRTALVARVTAYCREAGIAPRTLCERAINDPNFFNKIKSNGNFTVRTYQRLNRYMDKHTPKRPSNGTAKAARKRNGA